MSSAVGLALLATACGLSAGCQGSATTAQPQYAPGYGPYPPGYAPPGYAPGYAPPGGYAPAAANAPRPGYAAGPQPGYAQGAVPQQVAPGSSTFAGALNMSALQSIASRNPKACGLLQVAPGVYARIDCQAYAPSQRAVAHLSPRKALALQHHTTQWQPLQFFGARFQQAMAQGFSKGIFQRPVNGVNGTQQGVAGAAGAPVVTADPVPGTVDHRTQNLEGPIKDQGPVGACTAFSLSATIDNAAIRAGKMQAGVGSQASSPNHVWSGYGFPQMGAAADATLNRPLSTLAVWGANFSEECKISSPTTTAVPQSRRTSCRGRSAPTRSSRRRCGPPTAHRPIASSASTSSIRSPSRSISSRRRSPAAPTSGSRSASTALRGRG